MQVDSILYGNLSLQGILQYDDSIVMEEQVKNKVNFLMNNLTDMNMDKQASELKVFLETSEHFLVWFARYLVLRRATLESEGTILLISSLITKLNKPRLF